MPRLDGIEPVRLLLVTLALFNNDSIPKVDGIVPRRLLLLTSNNVNDVNPPRDEGKYPDSPLPATLIDTINPPEHITFCQFEVLPPEHTFVTFGNPPMHCHVLFNAELEHIPADTQRSHIIFPSDHEADGDLVTVSISDNTGIALLSITRLEGLDVGDTVITDGKDDGCDVTGCIEGDNVGNRVGRTLGYNDGVIVDPHIGLLP